MRFVELAVGILGFGSGFAAATTIPLGYYKGEADVDEYHIISQVQVKEENKFDVVFEIKKESVEGEASAEPQTTGCRDLDNSKPDTLFLTANSGQTCLEKLVADLKVVKGLDEPLTSIDFQYFPVDKSIGLLRGATPVVVVSLKFTEDGALVGTSTVQTPAVAPADAQQVKSSPTEQSEANVDPNQLPGGSSEGNINLNVPAGGEGEKETDPKETPEKTPGTGTELNNGNKQQDPQDTTQGPNTPPTEINNGPATSIQPDATQQSEDANAQKPAAEEKPKIEVNFEGIDSEALPSEFYYGNQSVEYDGATYNLQEIQVEFPTGGIKKANFKWYVGFFDSPSRETVECADVPFRAAQQVGVEKPFVFFDLSTNKCLQKINNLLPPSTQMQDPFYMTYDKDDNLVIILGDNMNQVTLYSIDRPLAKIPSGENGMAAANNQLANIRTIRKRGKGTAVRASAKGKAAAVAVTPATVSAVTLLVLVASLVVL